MSATRLVQTLAIDLRAFPERQRRQSETPFPYEFHILKEIREKYGFDESLFAFNGNVIIPNFRAARLMAQKMNDQRDLANHPETAVRPGQLNAMGLIDEISHYLIRSYEELASPGAFHRAEKLLDIRLGASKYMLTLEAFTRQFPPIDVYQKKIGAGDFLRQRTGTKTHTEIAIEELILLCFANINPAFRPFRELFDDSLLKSETQYSEMIELLEEFFRAGQPYGTAQQTIFDLLRAPILASPDSLEGQLAFIHSAWGMILSHKLIERIPGAGDFIKEDYKAVTTGSMAATPVPRYRPGDEGFVEEMTDIERFTKDRDWMPEVVLIAKNIYVWLHQLSASYHCHITRLDQIPDEELDRLARWNLTGLWLIGIWERSTASSKIKQMTGNPEAAPSAYSVYDYIIASDLGGEEAFDNLRRRAWHRGIRLAGDMVPNHMGLYSKWILEHPKYFIQLPYSPFPNYRFTGADLSDDPAVQLRIEDGYWNRSDAAVVFQRIDSRTGDVKYIYHGNDGTSYPWNDTAQLDFLRQEVREAVIQTIFHVAGKFPIIRFDAAMVLAKKHFQRLWYPQPGTGGDIPSRADHAMAKDAFDRMFPVEFWREVVDRINLELPNTLLLAEAFWMLEGYFVRTLGMHRVYNSAFMHMLMKEENAAYREAIRNTLHYNPEILKRYVNFMSNPDEQTAIGQFGKEDKYFGVATMLVTLPGLPMFAHGQIEGFTEKYGMEYRKAYYEETADQDLIRRHEREIIPLLAKRHLFSQVANFELYDFHDARGFTNENVFAYTNVSGNERAIVCFHNKYEECRGWIKLSVGKTTTAGVEGGQIASRHVGEALELRRGEELYYLFMNHISGLQCIRSADQLHEQGIYFELRAFEHQVFLDFREVHDATGEYGRLARHLDGRGVPSIDEEMQNLVLAPVHRAAEVLLAPDIVEDFNAYCFAEPVAAFEHSAILDRLSEQFGKFMRAAQSHLHTNFDITTIETAFQHDCLTARRLFNREIAVPTSSGGQPEWIHDLLMHLRIGGGAGTHRERITLYLWMVVSRLDDLRTLSSQNGALFDELHLSKIASALFPASDRDPGQEADDLGLIQLLVRHGSFFLSQTPKDAVAGILELTEKDEVRSFLLVNCHDGVWYYNKESFEDLVEWLFTVAVIRRVDNAGPTPRHDAELRLMLEVVELFLESSEASRYTLEGLKALLSSTTTEAIAPAK